MEQEEDERRERARASATHVPAGPGSVGQGGGTKSAVHGLSEEELEKEQKVIEEGDWVI